jgi:uncharacterized integral membrane protein
MYEHIDNPEAAERRSSPLLRPKVIIAGVIGLLALVFILQNAGSRRVEFLLWDVTAPSWLWMLVLFGAGVAVGSVFPWFRRRPKA